MTDRQTSFLNMFRNSASLLMNTTETADVPGLPRQVAHLSANLAELNALGEAQNRVTRGKTARRDKLLDTMKESAVDLATAIAAYASDARLVDLAATVNVRDRDFDKARIPHRPWIATRIADTAESVLDKLGPYKVTIESVTALRTTVAEVHAALAEPRTTIAEKSQATTRIAEVLDNTLEVLEQIDRLVHPLRKTNPEFYALYLTTRTVVGRPSGDSSPEAATAPAAATAAPAAATPAHEKLAA